MLPCCS